MKNEPLQIEEHGIPFVHLYMWKKSNRKESRARTLYITAFR